MKKRTVLKKWLSLTLAVSMTCVPVMAQDTFTSQAQEEQEVTQEESAFDDADTDTETGSDFSSGEEPETFEAQDDEEMQTDSDTEENGNIRYIKGRPLTEEETEEQLAPIRQLTELPAAPEPESNLETYGQEGSAARAVSYPQKYDSRETGLVTSVKNQNPFGVCWAFGMASLMETSLLAQGEGTYDLSEEHLAYFFSHRQNDPLGNTPDDKNEVAYNYHHVGGNDYLAALFLSTWSGMTTEEDVPFPTDPSHTLDLTQAIVDEKAYNAVAYLKNASFSSYSVSRMKDMLLSDYAVAIMFSMKTQYYNADTAAYCYPVTGSGQKVLDHIVTVVGWDDTYSKDNFKKSSNVTSDGAWIVKNSWGSDWGDGGYFYLSYEDENISNLVSVQATDTQKYGNNYFYDGSSAITTIALQPNQSVACIYQATAGNGHAETLGEVNVVSMSDNASYKIQVYTDLQDSSNPQSGTPAYEVPCTYVQKIAGVQTISIPEVTLFQNSRYSVVITNAGSNKISFGVEADRSYSNGDGSSWFTAIAGIENGQSFFRGTSSGWTDTVKSGWSARIKAHTKTLEQPMELDTPVFTVKASNEGYNKVSWNAVSHAAGYAVYRKKANASKWSRLIMTDSKTYEYQDSAVTANTAYQYMVRAYYKVGKKTYLSSYTTEEIKAAPKKQYVSSVKKQSTGIRITWTPQKNCDGYRIYRKTATGKYQGIKTISGGSVSTYLDKTAQKGVLYYYVVKAYVKEPDGIIYSKYRRSDSVKR